MTECDIIRLTLERVPFRYGYGERTLSHFRKDYLMSRILPYGTQYQNENGRFELFTAKTPKQALSDARPLAKKGFSPIALVWDQEEHDWTTDPDRQAIYDALPKPGSPVVRRKGNTDLAMSLRELSQICTLLSGTASKRPLSANDQAELLTAIMEVVNHSGLDLSEVATPEMVEA